MATTKATRSTPPTKRASARPRTIKALVEPRRDDATPRRAIFIDVENTSSEEALLAALDQIGFDRVGSTTELVAVGNWRVIGAHVARMLAQRGARLVHTAPAPGVKDWSDLSIAVAAGTWLGRARPGDTIEIVSADRAFDAVGDASAALGVTYRRVAYASTAVAPERAPARRSRRGGRHGRRGGAEPAAARPIQTRTPSPPAQTRRSEPSAAVEPMSKDIHAAPHEEILATIARLTANNPERGVNLDLLINALKDEGYGRPPGSPRLVTRLRMMKDIEVSPTGMVRVVPGAVVPPPREEPVPAPENGATSERRPRRRGGRRRRSRGPREETSAASSSSTP